MSDSLRDRIFHLMSDGAWRSLQEIEAVVGASATGISAKLRQLRSREYGGHTVESRIRAHGVAQVWEYRLQVDTDAKPPEIVQSGPLQEEWGLFGDISQQPFYR